MGNRSFLKHLGSWKFSGALLLSIGLKLMQIRLLTVLQIWHLVVVVLFVLLVGLLRVAFLSIWVLLLKLSSLLSYLLWRSQKNLLGFLFELSVSLLQLSLFCIIDLFQFFGITGVVGLIEFLFFFHIEHKATHIYQKENHVVNILSKA